MMTFGIYWAHYERWYYLYWLLPVGIVLLYRVMQYWNQGRRLVAYRYQSLLLHHYSLIKKIVKSILIFIAFTAIFLAFLSPQWGKKEQIVAQEGRDVLIAIDISRSMLAQDVKPNRLQCAKEKIKKLLYNLSCERVGLIIFSSSTIIQCPLTTDYAAFFLFLDQLDVDTISQGTTAIDQAITSALQVFESIPTRKTKLLVAFTDGEDFSANLQGVKERVMQEKLSIFTVGIGTEHGAPVPVLNEKGQQIGWEKDEHDHIIMSSLHEDLLMNIADASGGRYIRASSGDDDIKVLIDAINTFEKDRLEDKMFESLQEQYPYCVAIAFICYALEWIL